MKRIEYQLTAQDVVDANLGHLKSSRVRYVLWFVGAVNLIWVGNCIITRSRPFADYYWSLFLGLFLTIGYPLLTSVSARAAFRKQPAMQKPASAAYSPEGLTMESALYTGETKWPAFVSYLETPRLFVLYHGPRAFRPIPKRAFTNDADLREFRALLEEKIGVYRDQWLI